MNKKGPKTIQKLFSLTPVHVDYINHFIEEKGLLSQSDVVRQALSFFHDKNFPAYVYKEKSAAGEIKRKKLEEERLEKQISPEDFCKQIGAPLFHSVSGIDFAVTFALGHEHVAYPVHEIMQIFEKDPFLLTAHRNESINFGPLGERLKRHHEYMEDLHDKYGIINEQTVPIKQTDTADSPVPV